MDTDSIVKMGRYGVLNYFEALALARGHARPFRRLYEIKGKIGSARRDPSRSIFRSKVALEMCWSFSSDCAPMPGAEDNRVLEMLLNIDGVDAGEALLIEYALRNRDACIVSGDKRMIRGLCSPAGVQFHAELRGRVLHIDRVIQELAAQPDRWPAVRAAIIAVPECDVGIYEAVAPKYEDTIAQQRLLQRASDGEAASSGLLRTSM